MSKRKSYCGGRRRSRSIGGYATNGFSELIDPSLPPDKRLQELLERTFEHCLSVVQREVSVNDNYEQKGTECWEKIKREIDDRALCSAAASENTVTEDFKTTKALQSCNRAIYRYEAESMKWNSLILRLRNELNEEVETNPSVIETDMDIDEPLFDYSNVIKQQASIPVDILDQTQVMLDRSKMLSECLRRCKKSEEKLSLNTRLLWNIESDDTPRRIIKNIVINGKKCFHKFRR